MQVEAGSRLGRYEILCPLGKGGMGEVYRARDPEVDRDVAIKVLGNPSGSLAVAPQLREALADDPERLARFEREAKALAALQHSNVATLYGLERQDGQPFLVMELVAGEDLSERFARGPLDLDEAVEVFSQIADGLAAAHDRGLVHRDLKPANVKITPEGQVKVLDFGLAKAVTEETSGDAELTQSPTLTAGATAVGVLLGTAAYMSPEQVKSRPFDRRTDVWAWGCCLYEALTGKRAFEGDDVTEILASVLKEEPDWSALPPSLSSGSGVVRLLERTLQKEPGRRWRDLGDARFALEEAATEGAPDEGGGPPRRRSARPGRGRVSGGRFSRRVGPGFLRAFC